MASLEPHDDDQSEKKHTTTTSVGAITQSIMPDVDLPEFLAEIAISAPALSLKIEKIQGQ